MTIKMVFFDMEGTLIINNDGLEYSSLWGCIAQALGEEAMADGKKIEEKWGNGDFRSYVEWGDACMESFRKRGLTKQLLRKLLEEATMRDGVRETVAELHRRGIVTVIISGGFHQQAAKVQLELDIHHALSGVQVYWNRDGTVAGWNALPAHDDGKMNFMELMRHEYKLSPEECAFVGNGINDVIIAQHAGISFAVADAHKLLKATATHTLADFRDLLKHI